MKNTFYTLGAGLVLAGAAQAVTLAEYAFTSAASNQLAVTSELYAGSSSVVTLGSAWTAGTDLLNLDLADSNTNQIAAQNGFSFVYTVTGLTAGQALNITNLSLDVYSFENTKNTVRYAFYVDGVQSGSTVDPANDVTVNYNHAFTPGENLSGLSNGDSFVFKFGMRDNTSGSMTADNFILSGEVVAVPEPSSTALLGLGGIAVILRRRR
ncbi:PEP-CTERM sorting domain-containing protein [Rubritalea spongiae]|uniref:PEP-CTERM sorting domain-containing protein n=1 Tax=Rubritalea spongiae TaxID=430797 RepID=A0ABW5DZW7_9BACT